MVRRSGKFLIISLLVLSLGLFQFVQADTQSQGITVGATVPAQDSGGSGGGGRGNENPPPPEVDAPPVISAVVSEAVFTEATITWSATDDKGIIKSLFSYGTTMAYGMSGVVTGGYQTTVTGLVANTVYFFKITVTDTVNQNTEFTGSFKTKTENDTTAPLITNVQVVPGENTATITWDTNEPADSQIQYGETAGYGSLATDASDVVNHSVVLVGLEPNLVYHFKIISTDPNGNAGNTMDATFQTLKKIVPPPDVSNLTISVVNQTLVLRWENPPALDAADFAGVKVIRKIGSRPQTVVDGTELYSDQGQMFVDSEVAPNIHYFYTLFSFDTSGNLSAGVFGDGEVPPPVGQEICTNKIDDNDNGKIDCDDSACSKASACQAAEEPAPQDPNAPEPSTPTPGEPGAAVPSSTVPIALRITNDKLTFFAVNRTVQLGLRNGTVSSLAGHTFTVSVPKSVLPKPAKSLVVVVDGQDQHQLAYNETEGVYYTDFVFPAVGSHSSYLAIDYGDEAVDTIGFVLMSYGSGKILDATSKPISGAKATLLYENGTVVPMNIYRQNNPLLSDLDGKWGWVLPNGRYYAVITAPGHYDFTANLEEVLNNVFAPTVTLITIPPSLADVIDFNKPLGENIKNISQNLAAKTQAAAQLLNNLTNNPEVQKVASDVVAPATISVVAISAAPLISWVDILPLLRLVFLQPVLLLGRKKRQGWGQVYNSLNKLPVDLAIIRLIDAKTGRVVQSHVTDKNGRYYFTVNPGDYRLEVSKEKMTFPSSLLKGFTTDGKKADIYHGEPVVIREKDPVITANIPLDPSGENKTPRRLIVEKIGKKIQVALSWFGLAVTGVSLYISPKWYVGALLVGHVAMFFVFRRLAIAKKPKSWGIVYDSSTKMPITRAVARLFSSQFNKLISTQITDSRGRYYFLAGDNQYFVTYDHKDYAPAKSPTIDLSGQEIATIGSNVELIKKNSAATPTPQPAPPSTPPEQL